MSRAGEMIKDFIPESDLQIKEIESNTLEDRIDHIIDNIDQGIKDPSIHNLIAFIIKESKVPERDYEGEAIAVFDWVRDNVRYTLDPTGIEMFRKPTRTVEQGIADCDDMSILICSLLGAIGHNLILRVIGVTKNQPEHIYPVDLLPPEAPSETLALDATRPEEVGWEVPESSWLYHEDFEIFENE